MRVSRAKVMADIEADKRRISAERNADKARSCGFGEGVRGMGRARFINGRWVSADEAPAGELRTSDAGKPCAFSGCGRAQVPEFNQKFGHLGVTYLPNGDAVYRDYQSKKRVLQARGMVDLDGNWSGKNV